MEADNDQLPCWNRKSDYGSVRGERGRRQYERVFRLAFPFHLIDTSNEFMFSCVLMIYVIDKL